MKKYHQRPGFGVRSGSEKLWAILLLSKLQRKTSTYNDPHVCAVQCTPPVIELAMIENMITYMKYSRMSGTSLIQELNLDGVASDEYGPLKMSIAVGIANNIAGNAKWVRKARVRRAYEDFPS